MEIINQKIEQKPAPKDISDDFSKFDRFILWAPRILAIIFILFLMMFSLDVFKPGLGAWQIVVGLLMHNLPALVLLAVLIISWRRPLVGGIVFLLAGTLYILDLITGSNFQWYMLSWMAFIAGPAWLIGVLFLLNWRKKRQTK